MDSIFRCNDYKKWIVHLVANMPKRGRGQFAKLAQHLRLNPSRVSQIIKGPLHLTAEQAQNLGDFFGWSTFETEYFVTLVLRDRAETKELRAIFDAQLTRMREKSQQIVNRVPRDRVLSDVEKAEFYSNWLYSAIRLATSIDGLADVGRISEFFGVDRRKVGQILEFLKSTGLCIEKDGKIQMGPKTTHLEHSSPFVLRHHSNWRVRALSRHESLQAGELAYSCPVSLRGEDMAVIHEMLTQLIEKFLKNVTASDPADTLACLNIDWFRVVG